MTKQQNVRSLNAIAESIHALERGNIIDIGDLLIEAKGQCEHGDWLDWLETEFEWSIDTAERYMTVARLGSKFRKLRNLKIGKTTLYALENYDEEELPAIIDELAKHDATATRLRPSDAERVIQIGIGRHRFGDYSDETLRHLVIVQDGHRGSAWYEEAVAALKKQNPETEAEAEEIWFNVMDQHRTTVIQERQHEQRAKEEADLEARREAEAILDGPSTDLGSPEEEASPEPQKISTGLYDTFADADGFGFHVKRLLSLRTKPAAHFVGQASTEELRGVIGLLSSVLSMQEKKTADGLDIPPLLDRRHEKATA
jgi:Protein of unknown function (DUF3102)